MRLPRTWRVRCALGLSLGVLVVLAWVRREASIATTPTAPAASGITHQESGARVVLTTSSSISEKNEVQRAFVLLSVPFVSQAPFRTWDLPYKEFCEEASVLTLHYWKQGKRPPPADQLDRDLKDIQAWEDAHLRTWADTTAEETAQVLREKFRHSETRVVRHATIEGIKRELDAGRPVIVPAAGRELSSPYYRPPGPLYHMLVIIGYDDARREFITNDVGTNTKGAGFRFAEDDLYGAMGDWDVERSAPDTSQKVFIVME